MAAAPVDSAAGGRKIRLNIVMEDEMKSSNIAKSMTAFAVVAALAGCSTWHRMDKTEGTVAGGAGGAVAGAVVGGPVGAVVGGVGGAYVGNEVAGKDQTATSSTSSSSTASSRYDPALVRSVQQALNDKGYSAGSIDGQWGPATEDAVRRFQRASGLPQTGELEQSTLTALGVAPTR
jgi:murein L,D-transpeptidase YcbB/YkuD